MKNICHFAILVTTVCATLLTLSIHPVNADEVITDDLIVDGRACIGNSCSNGESFNDGILKLDASNDLGIHFDPGTYRNEWQMLIDGDNLNRFTIRDLNGATIPFSIEPGAGDNSLFISDNVELSSYIGMGTSNPQKNLHLVGNFSPSIRLEKNDAIHAPGTWDIVGGDQFYIKYVNADTVPFLVEPGAPDDSLFIRDDGNVGIGSADPQEELVIESSTPCLRLDDRDYGQGKADLKVNNDYFFLSGNSTDVMTISTEAPFWSFNISKTGYVGLRTPFPLANLHLAGGGGDATFLFETTGNGWYMLNKNASGRFNITDDPTFARVPFKIGVGAKQNLLKMGCGATDEVYISGNLIVAGTITPDYVFEDRYPLQSIEEHADFMWKEKHLPAVEKAKVDEEGKGVVNLGKRSQELLEELETAHIYIQQLNKEIKALKSLNSTMENKIINLEYLNDEKMKEIENRLAKIES